MGAFKIKKNGVVYENNKMPGAYPAERVAYDNTESGLTANNAQGAIDEVNDNKANKTDLTNISQSGATATQAISSGTYFYLDGVLVRAKTAIASGATFTLNTNYEVVTAGGLNELYDDIIKEEWTALTTFLASSGNTWEIKTLPNISSYKKLVFAITSGDNIVNPIEVSTSYFKHSFNTANKYVSLRSMISSNQYLEAGFYYKTDTTIGYISNSTIAYTKVWGIK